MRIKPKAASRTRAEDIRLQLADEIVEGALTPGQQLDEKGLACRFGVSRTPIREALRLLETSGLVELRPHRGCFVKELSPESLHEMFVAMAELEAACAGLAAIHMTREERGDLQALLEQLAEIMRSGDPQRYHVHNEDFHSAIYSGSHNGYLASLTLQTRQRLAPFRRAQFRTLGRLKKSQTEHVGIVNAILRGQRDEAAKAMRDHIDIVEINFARYQTQIGQGAAKAVPPGQPGEAK
ncbi:GntR family transcriptional regulator [Roseibium marinum]|uniref:DNA-binding GntR family transcriptional regulator n=1 Tax=Roseibium marinum TaxID=281252 RepID=A0A2S3V300_9HYPH|nr:GntR family transcriptional regulator [Roseibium marinum]POF34270.1 DNA-binding GntR family transcriptional regulator [Roseibium marinum]